MKFRTGLLLGLAVGYGLAKRSALTQDDPYVVKGPQREQSSSLLDDRAPPAVLGARGRRPGATSSRSGHRREPRRDPPHAFRDPEPARRVIRRRRGLELTYSR